MTSRTVFTTLALLLAMMLAVPAYTQTETPKGPYLLLKEGASGEVSVLMTTDNAEELTLEWGISTAYGNSVYSTAQSIVPAPNEYLHTCTITGLDDNTKYYYRVMVEGTEFTGSFVTPPSDEATSLKFFVFSDPQEADRALAYDNGQNLAAQYILNTMDNDPDFQTFLLCAGDVANDRLDYFQSFFNAHTVFDANLPMREMLRNSFIQTAKGNHDYWDMEYNIQTEYFNTLFSYTADRQYYSFDYGPAHIIVLDEYAPMDEGSEQLEWLATDLANTDKPWKFIVTHEPGYSPYERAPSDNIRDFVQPLCLEYNVTAVFSGHHHVYSRAHVSDEYGQKVRHIITSTLGESLRPTNGRGDSVLFARGSIRNIIKIEIENDHTLHYTPVNTMDTEEYGAEFDRFTIHRPYNIRETSNTGGRVVISWDTDVAGGDTLFYALSREEVFSDPMIAHGDGGFDHSVTVEGLDQNTTYHFRVKTNGEVSEYMTFTTITVPPAVTPQTQASDVTVRNIGSTAMTVGWTIGDGNARIVVMREDNAVTGDPVDQTYYTANSQFGMGATLSPGNYVIYNGSGDSVRVTGLKSSTDYHIAVFEYNITENDFSEAYLGTPARGSAATLIGAPVALQATDRNEEGFTATWHPVEGADGYWLDISYDDTFAVIPAEYENIEVNDTTYLVSGLSQEWDDYYYRLRAWRDDEASDYSNVIAVRKLASLPLTQAGEVIFSDVGTHSLTVSWTKGDGDYSLVVIRAEEAVEENPVNGQSYNASTSFGRGTGLGSETFVVYNGDEEEVEITDLSPGMEYHVAIYSFNGSGSSENYLTEEPARGSQITDIPPYEYFSTGSGIWSDPGIWEIILEDGERYSVTSAPGDYTETIHILGGHFITISADLNVSNVIELSSGGRLEIDEGVTLTLNENTDAELFLSGTLVNSGTIIGERVIDVSGSEIMINNGVISVSRLRIGSSGTLENTGELSVSEETLANGRLENSNILNIQGIISSSGNGIIENSGTINVSALFYFWDNSVLINSGSISTTRSIIFNERSKYVHEAVNTPIPPAVWDDESWLEFGGSIDEIPSGIYTMNLSMSGSEKSIPSDGYVTVQKNLTTNNLLVIESESSSSGSLIITGDTITGLINYKRSIPLDEGEQLWHYISSPVAEPELDTEKSILRFKEETGEWLTLTAAIQSGSGYAVRGGGTLDLIGSPEVNNITITATSPYADSFDGIDYTGRELVIGRGYGAGGWNLLGNPYTSALSVADFITANHNSDDVELSSFDPNYVALYIFDGTGYQYVTNDETGWEPAEWHDFTNFDSENIQAGQGFFVLAMSDGAQFTFTRSMQQHAISTLLLKSSGNKERWPGLALKVSNGKIGRETVVLFNDGMTRGLDPLYDVGLMSSGSDINLYTALVEDNGVNFARQALPALRLFNDAVPVGLDYARGGKVTFSADIEAVRGFSYWLEDKETGILTNLGKDSYTVTLPENTYGTGRFWIHSSFGRPERQRGVENNLLSLRIWPSGDRQVIIQGEVSDNARCEVYGTNGEKIKEKPLQGGDTNRVTIPGSRQGVYLIKVTDGIYTEIQRVVIL